MSDQWPTKKDLDDYKRYSIKLRILVVSVTAIIILCLISFARYNAKQKINSIKDNKVESTELDRRSNLNDLPLRYDEESSKRVFLPIDSIFNVRELVKTKVPSYSWIYLWRMDDENWIMKYMRVFGDKEHWFMQRFNPITKKFEKQ